MAKKSTETADKGTKDVGADKAPTIVKKTNKVASKVKKTNKAASKVKKYRVICNGFGLAMNYYKKGAIFEAEKDLSSYVKNKLLEEIK